MARFEQRGPPPARRDRPADRPTPAGMAVAVPALRRVVIGVDPPATIGGDGCGIVAAGVDAAGSGYVRAI